MDLVALKFSSGPYATEAVSGAAVAGEVLLRMNRRSANKIVIGSAISCRALGVRLSKDADVAAEHAVIMLDFTSANALATENGCELKIRPCVTENGTRWKPSVEDHGNWQTFEPGPKSACGLPSVLACAHRAHSVARRPSAVLLCLISSDSSDCPYYR